MIDTTALEILEKLQSELAKKEIILAWARLRIIEKINYNYFPERVIYHSSR